MELVSILGGTGVFHYKHVATFAYKMSFNTFVPAEFRHRFWEIWHGSYGTQYETLAKHVETSWNDDQKANQRLTDYLDTIRIGTTLQEIQWEHDAWDTIWDNSKRIQVVETLGKLKQMLPYDNYVDFIHQYIFNKHDVLEMIEALPPDGSPPDGSLLSFLKGELKVAATNHFKLQGVYTNNGDKLSTIGDLNGDFDATIRVLQNMGIIKVTEATHLTNKHIITMNATSQDQKLRGGSDSSLYQPLVYEAYTWDYGANMLVQTGNLFDGSFNSREIIELFMHLDKTSGDGQVVNMAGDREFGQYQDGLSYMNNFVTIDIAKDSMSFATVPNAVNSDKWQTNRNRNLLPGSKYFEWIAQLPIVVYETQSKTIFSHGSIVSKWTDVCAVNSHVQKYWEYVGEQLKKIDYNEMKTWNFSDLRENLSKPLRDDDSPLNSGQGEEYSENAGPVLNHYYSNVVNADPEDRLDYVNEYLEQQLELTHQSFKDHKYLVDRLICTDFTSKPQQYPVEETPSVWFIASVFAIDDENAIGDANMWGGVELNTTDGVTQVTTKQGKLK